MTNKRYAFGWATVSTSDTTYVLAAGGYGDCTGNFCALAERYNTSTGNWGSAGAMSTPRIDFPLVVVSDGSGRAFATGGQTGPNSNQVTATVESYDASFGSNGQWDGKTQMGTQRKGHSAVALVNASSSYRIIVLGGRNHAGTFLNSGEFYTPVPEPQNGSWSATGTSTVARYGHTLTRLANDLVIVVGGAQSGSACTATVERYNPLPANNWTTLASIGGTTCYHAAVKLEPDALGNSSLLITGGRASPSGDSSNVSKVYDPVMDQWSSSYPMVTPRYRHTATLYPVAGGSDKVIAAGGIKQIPSPPTNEVVWEGELFTP